MKYKYKKITEVTTTTTKKKQMRNVKFVLQKSFYCFTSEKKDNIQKVRLILTF